MSTDERAQVRRRLTDLTVLLAADPRNASLLKQCARLALELREFTAAMCYATEAIEAQPGDAEAQFEQASALIGSRSFSEAARKLEALRASGHHEPGIDYNLALCFYALGQFAAARPLLDSLIAAGHAGPDVLRLAVSTLHNVGELQDAVALANSHPLGDPGDGPAAGVYALVFLDAGRAQDAERYAGMALRHNPDSIDGLTVCATLRLWHADGDAAERVFQGIIARAPATGRAWIGLGATALLRQDLTEAVRCLTRGVELMPAHAGSRQILGWTYLVRGDLDAAERVFREGIELDRNFGEAHGALASLFALRGQRSESEEEIRIADRLDRAGFAARFAQALLAGEAADSSATRALVHRTLRRLLPRLSTQAARMLMATSPQGPADRT